MSDYMVRPSRRATGYGKGLDSTSKGQDETLHPKADRQKEQNRSKPVDLNMEGYGKGSSVKGMCASPVKGIHSHSKGGTP